MGYSTLSAKYEALKEHLEKSRFGHQKVICKHIGIKNSMGGYLTEPRTDADGLPQLNAFLKKNLPEVKILGWEEYTPAEKPKPATKKSSK